MKLDSARTVAFLRDPGAMRLALLHGEDHGLVRDRASQLVMTVAGSLDDPFDVVELDRDAVAMLPGEMMSRSLTGRRRVIRIREAGDAATDFVKRGLATGGDAFVVLEAGVLPPRSKLRMLVEAAGNAMAIPCYAMEGTAAASLVSAVLRESGVTADSDAARWLAETMTGDQGLLRGEAEKLALLVGPDGRADLEAAMLSAGEPGGLSVEDALYAATAGDIGRADRATETALAEGATAVGLMRAALMHIHRLLRARMAVDGGLSASDAISRLRPSLYFRRYAAFTRALGWGATADFTAIAQYLTEVERACKRTGVPADALAKGAILAIARRAAQGRRN